MKKMILPLLVLSSVAQSDELDNLIDTSSAIVDQLTTGIKLVGAASYAHHGDALPLEPIAKCTHKLRTIQAYNAALYDMANYKPYGDMQTV